MSPSRYIIAAVVFVALLVTVFAVTSVTVITGIAPTSVTINTASVITLTGTPSATGDLLLFCTDCTGCTPATAVASSAATVTQSAIATGLKLCYRKSGESDSKEQTGITLNVIAVTSNTVITAISPTGIYATVSSNIILFGVAQSGDKAIFASSCAGQTPNVALTVGSNKVTAFTMASTGINFRLCYRTTGGTDSVAQDNIFLSVSAVGGVGADPVTWFGDKVRVFSLPVKTLMPVLHASDMTLHGETFMHGGPWQQWFGRMVLASPAGDRWVQIAVRKDILEFNRSTSIKGHFESLEVTLGHGSFDEPTTKSVVPGPAIEIPLNFLGFDVVFWKMARNSRAAHTRIGAAARECMEVAGANIHFYVCSSPAHEFYGHQRDLSIKHAHLDLAIIEVLDATALSGTLPELWGMKPMTAETEKYIVDEHDAPTQTSSKQIAQIAAADGAIPMEAPSRDVLIGLKMPALPEGSLPAGKGWAGGLGFNDLEKSCQQDNQTVLGCALKENQTVKLGFTTVAV